MVRLWGFCIHFESHGVEGSLKTFLGQRLSFFGNALRLYWTSFGKAALPTPVKWVKVNYKPSILRNSSSPKRETLCDVPCLPGFEVCRAFGVLLTLALSKLALPGLLIPRSKRLLRKGAIKEWGFWAPTRLLFGWKNIQMNAKTQIQTLVVKVLPFILRVPVVSKGEVCCRTMMVVLGMTYAFGSETMEASVLLWYM